MPPYTQYTTVHTVWRTWLFTAYPNDRWLYYQSSLFAHFSWQGWENVFFWTWECCHHEFAPSCLICRLLMKRRLPFLYKPLFGASLVDSPLFQSLVTGWCPCSQFWTFTGLCHCNSRAVRKCLLCFIPWDNSRSLIWPRSSIQRDISSKNGDSKVCVCKTSYSVSGVVLGSSEWTSGSCLSTSAQFPAKPSHTSFLVKPVKCDKNHKICTQKKSDPEGFHEDGNAEGCQHGANESSFLILCQWDDGGSFVRVHAVQGTSLFVWIVAWVRLVSACASVGDESRHTEFFFREFAPFYVLRPFSSPDLP